MKRLNDVLRQWARRKSLPDDNLDSLTRDILSRVERIESLEKRPEPETVEWPRPFFARPGINWFRMALVPAAISLLVVCYYHYLTTPQQQVRLHPDLPRPESSQAAWSQLAGLPERDHDKNFKVYDEISRLFPGQVKWIRQDNGDIDFELLPANEVKAGPKEYVMVRFVVLKQDGGEDWQTQQVTDITAAAEEVINVPLPQQLGDVRFWTHELPDGLFVLDSTVQSAAVAQGPVSSDGILRSGQTRVVYELQGTDARYKIVQTIRRLCGINQKDCG